MTPSCPLCHAPSPRRFFARGHAIHRCAACDLEFVSPTPTEEALRAVYERDYFQGEGAGYQDYFGAERALAERKAAQRLDTLASLGASRGRLLDVGSAAGYFVSAARARGFDAHGVEPSPEARASLSSELSALTHGELQGALAEGPYEVITLWDVLEHLADPFSTLRALKTALRPGGLLAVVVPVLGSVNTRLAPATWDQYKPPEHLWFFSPRSLRAAVTTSVGARVAREEVAWERLQRFTVPGARGPFARLAGRLEGGLWRLASALGGRAWVTDSLALYAVREEAP